MTVTDRIRAGLNQFPSRTKVVDEYLSAHFNELLDRFDIARGPDLKDTVEYIDNKEAAVSMLHQWRTATSQRIEGLEDRVGRLEIKYGVK
jgi:hypothetical protein